MQNDVTNFTYGGAVDSQSQQIGNTNTRRHVHNATHHHIQEEDLTVLHGQTEQETQFSMLNGSAAPATYESLALASGTNKSRVHTGDCSDYDLPILNVSSLAHLDDIIQHRNTDPRSGPASNNIDLLAVIFEVGESKDIPIKTFARGATGRAHPNTNRLSSIKICQPHRDGQEGIAVMEVSLWGKLAERTETTKYRFVKGDVVWFKSE